MKVLVRFKGDNDFGRVLRAFGSVLLTRVEDESFVHAPLTSERVAQWFNALAPMLYEMLQHRDQPNLEGTKAYLKISSEDVYVGSAADEKLKTAHEWSNYDSVMVDSAAREKVYLV